MILYYTGSDKALGVQTSPLSSLGGYISSSPVQNGSFNNIFQEIGQLELNDGSTSTRLVALRNETGVDQTVSLFYESSSNSLVYYKMALVSPATDNCGDNFFEKIEIISATPISATFFDNKGEDNSVSFPIAAGAYVGIWIQRVVLSNKGKEYLSCEKLLERFDSVETPSTISWSLTALASNEYFTIGDVAVVIDNQVDVFTPPSGYEILRVKYANTDTIADVEVLINAKIDEILVGRGLVTRNGNILTVEDLEVTPNSSTLFTLVSTEGNLNRDQENLSIVIDY